MGQREDAPEMTPEFSREAARALGSPYFTSPPPKGLTAAKQVAFYKGRDREKDALWKGLKGCRDERDLKGEAAAIYKRAKASLPRAKGG
jgi:hypothetical protein